MTSDELLLKILDQINSINNRLDSMDNRLDGMDTRLDGIDTRLNRLAEDTEILKLQHKATQNKLDGIDLRLTNLEYQTKKNFREVHQNIETLVGVLEAKGILPKAL